MTLTNKEEFNMQTNVQQKTALKQVSNILNTCDFLFGFEVESLPQRTELHILTDLYDAKFTKINNIEMISFLHNLKDYSPEHIDDIDELIDQLNDGVIYA